MKVPPSPQSDQGAIERDLLQEIRAASKSYRSASAVHERAIKSAARVNWNLAPKESESLYQAAEIARCAMERYACALKAFTDFVWHGHRVPIPPAAPDAPALALLTRRETEILTLVARGLSTRGIAASLSISFKTVGSHRSQIMQKLDIHDVASLVRFAIRNKLIEP